MATKAKTTEPTVENKLTADADMYDYRPHRYLDRYPLLSADELDAMVEDIREHGQRQQIDVASDRRTLIDGRNRLAACMKLGIAPDIHYSNIDADDDERVIAFIISANLRRHMTLEQKRDHARGLLKDFTEWPDRKIARSSGLAPTTVGTLRTDLEGSGDVSNLDTRIDSKGRKQPARKKTANPTTYKTVNRALAGIDNHIRKVAPVKNIDHSFTKTHTERLLAMVEASRERLNHLEKLLREHMTRMAEPEAEQTPAADTA